MAAQAKPGVQERILLHLLDYSDFKDSIEVPFALSQMGIANAVAIARSNVPRAIAGLKDQNILVERQAHVKGVSRKRKAYFLTDSGITLASETWDRLSDWPVRIVLDDQPAVSTTLGGAKGVLPFEMRPVDIIRYIDEHNCLDVRNFSADLVERDLSKHVEKQLVTSLADLPFRLRHFYGRATELDNMVNLLEARATTLLVPGIAGIGKTTMASKLIERFMHRRNLLYHRCQDWEGSRSFLSPWLIGSPAWATPISRPTSLRRRSLNPPMQPVCWLKPWRVHRRCWSSTTSTKCRTWSCTKPSKRCPGPAGKRRENRSGHLLAVVQTRGADQGRRRKNCKFGPAVGRA